MIDVIKNLKQIEMFVRKNRKAKVFQSVSEKGWKLSGMLSDTFVVWRGKDGQGWIYCTLCRRRIFAGQGANYDRCFRIVYGHLREFHNDLARKLEEIGESC